MTKNIFLIGLLSAILFSCSNNASPSESQGVSKVQVSDEFKTEALAVAKDPNQLVLTESNLGDLALYSNPDLITTDLIEEKLMYFNIESQKNEGFDESGPVDYFIGWKGAQLFSLTPNAELDNRGVKNLIIQSKGIVDEYGVKIGMTFEELLILRPNVVMSVDEISGNPRCDEEMSQISYGFLINDSKDNYSLQDSLNFSISHIMWSSEMR